MDNDEPTIGQEFNSHMRWFVTVLAVGHVVLVICAFAFVIAFASHFSVWTLIGLSVVVVVLGYSALCMIAEAHRCWEAHAVIVEFESKNKS